MADGWSTAAANSALDAHMTAYPWFQLHVGAPGAAGTSNAAGNTTRKQPTWAAASGGTKAFSLDVNWTSVGTAEQYSHYSLWSASSAGNFGSSGALSGNAVSAGDNVTIATGFTVSGANIAS